MLPNDNDHIHYRRSGSVRGRCSDAIVLLLLCLQAVRPFLCFTTSCLVL